MLARIREVLIIPTPEDTPKIEDLSGDGSQFGMELSYAVQEKPTGLAQAFTVGRSFIGDEPCAMVLGDNIFCGNGLGRKLEAAVKASENGSATKEKPKEPKSNYAIVGLCFYPKGVSDMAEKVTPNARGELEITTLNDMYLKEGRLNAQLLGRGYTWMDAGTVDSLQKATNFVCMIEQYQRMIISVPEEIAYRFGWIDDAGLSKAAERYGKSPYGNSLRAVLDWKIIV